MTAPAAVRRRDPDPDSGPPQPMGPRRTTPSDADVAVRPVSAL
ncbi:hypothetical protein ACH5A2_24615 [Streptomyces collinus]